MSSDAGAQPQINAEKRRSKGEGDGRRLLLFQSVFIGVHLWLLAIGASFNRLRLLLLVLS